MQVIPFTSERTTWTVHEIAHQLLRTVPPDEAGHRNDGKNIMHRDVDEVAAEDFHFASEEVSTLRRVLELGDEE